MTLNLILTRINYLTYLVPLAKEGLNRNLEVNIFLERNRKDFVNPFSYPLELKKCLDLGIKLHNLDQLPKSGLVFLVEGGIVGEKDNPPVYQYLTNKHNIVSLVCNYEVYMYLDKYYHRVNHIVFPDKIYFNDSNNSKYLALGSPKYDNLDELLKPHQIYKKYKLDPKNRYITVFYSKNSKNHHKRNRLDPTTLEMLELYSIIRHKGYKVIVKSRKQDRVTDVGLRGNYYFEDLDHYPVNSMELIKISEMIIYFSSSINEEAVALNTPYLDIKVDLEKDRFKFFDGDHSSRIPITMLRNKKNYGLISDQIDRLVKKKNKINKDLVKQFQKSNQNSSKKILDHFLNTNS